MSAAKAPLAHVLFTLASCQRKGEYGSVCDTRRVLKLILTGGRGGRCHTGSNGDGQLGPAHWSYILGRLEGIIIPLDVRYGALTRWPSSKERGY